MNKLAYIIIFGIGLLVSCDDFLDVSPTDAIPAEEVFKSKKGLDGALVGAYQVLQSASVYQDAVLFADLAADNLIHIGTKKEYRQISDNRILPENAYNEGIWNRSFDGINRANNIIEYIDNVADITEYDKENILGQTYFLRAFNYFNLVKYFGGVPIKQKPTLAATDDELLNGRATESETYQFITSDLLKAESLLEGKSWSGSIWISSGAVKALLARVYLYRHIYDSAAMKAAEVLNMNYSLEENDYPSIFTDQAGNNEIIFRVQFAEDDAINGIPDWTLPAGRFEVAAYTNYDKTASVADAFSNSDLRKQITVIDTTDVFYCNKYQDLLTDKDHVIFIRLAEMYLIRSEALNELAYVADGEAFNLLNAIRLRAGLPELTALDLIDQNAFRLAIEKERRLEFAFEGHRLFDLKRTGRINQVLPDLGTLKKANWLFPIPQSELDANNHPEMQQNTGY